MGVLSARSFVAPLIDKKNLIAIILVAVFFIVYRLSGGSIDTSSKSASSLHNPSSANSSFFEQFANSDDVSPIEDLKKIKKPKQAADFRPNTPPPSNDKENFIDGILKNKKGPAENRDKNTSHLDEIERSLGLR